MQQIKTFLGVLMTCTALLDGTAFAQDAAHEVHTQPLSEGSAPPPPDNVLRPYDKHDLDEAARQSRVVRNALIGTSAGFAVGAIIAGIGASQCTSFTRPNGTNDIDCNNAGDVLVPLGGVILGLNAVGMLTTGIMLGVRNKHKRDIERDIRRRYHARRLHFDEKSGGLVF
jgi:hypothetical protein